MFLNKNCAAEDLMCWMDIEGFRGVPLTDKYIRNVKAKQLRKQYFNKQYFFGPHSPATKEAQRQTRAAGGISAGARLPGRPRTPLFREAQKHIRARLEKRWLIQFINSPGFLERNKKTAFSKSSITTKSSQYVVSIKQIPPPLPNSPHIYTQIVLSPLPLFSPCSLNIHSSIPTKLSFSASFFCQGIPVTRICTTLG